jgi:hypothetical protein
MQDEVASLPRKPTGHRREWCHADAASDEDVPSGVGRKWKVVTGSGYVSYRADRKVLVDPFRTAPPIPLHLDGETIGAPIIGSPHSEYWRTLPSCRRRST